MPEVLPVGNAGGAEAGTFSKPILKLKVGNGEKHGPAKDPV